MRFMNCGKLLLILCVIVSSGGCVRTITRDELQQETFRGQGKTLISITFYCGSKGGYDYFHIQPGMGSSTGDPSGDYRVASSEEAVARRFMYTTDRRRWVQWIPTVSVECLPTIPTWQPSPPLEWQQLLSPGFGGAGPQP